jgi:hypothetical protein
MPKFYEPDLTAGFDIHSCATVNTNCFGVLTGLT